MNNFINWVAVNNTLMIRIGFTAILALLVIYVFRLFFLPKVNLVNELVDSENQNPVKSGGQLDEDELEKRKIVEQKQAEYYTNEIEKSLIEVAKLKDQLIDTNTLVTDLKEKNLELINQTRNAVVEAPSAGEAGDPEVVVELKSKVENLEARLSEYEIIAEDISEIGQLRKEIAELRRQAENAPTVAVNIPEIEPTPEAAPIPEPIPEPAPEPAPEPEINVEAAAVEKLDEAQIADLILAMETTASDAPATQENVVEEIQINEATTAPPVRLVGDKEVSASERDMLDHFEEISKKKGS